MVHRKTDPEVLLLFRLLPAVLLLAVLWFLDLQGRVGPGWPSALFWGLLLLAVADIVQVVRPALRRRLRPREEATSGPETGDGADRSDRPVEAVHQDQLGFAKYAVVLAKHIASWDTPLTLGIHGPWGSGKTSLANMIRHLLTPRRGKVEEEPIQAGVLNQAAVPPRDRGTPDVEGKPAKPRGKRVAPAPRSKAVPRRKLAKKRVKKRAKKRK